MHNRQAPYTHTWYLNTSLLYFKHVQANPVQETKPVFRKAASLKCPPQILTLYWHCEGTPGIKSTLRLQGTSWGDVHRKLAEKVLAETGQNRYFWGGEATCVCVCVWNKGREMSWRKEREEAKERAKKEKEMTLEIFSLAFYGCHWARKSFAFLTDIVFSFSLHHKFSQLTLGILDVNYAEPLLVNRLLIHPRISWLMEPKWWAFQMG